MWRGSLPRIALSALCNHTRQETEGFRYMPGKSDYAPRSRNIGETASERHATANAEVTSANRVQEIVSFAFTSGYDSSRSLGTIVLNIAGTVVAERNECKAGLERKLQSGGRAFFR